MNWFEELARQCGALKVQPAVAHYADAYLEQLEAGREQVRRVLEIGVHAGNSLKLWGEFFPHAEIHGVDNDPRCRQYEADGVHVHIGQQEDRPFLNNTLIPLGPFDIIIDDGGHRMDQQQISLLELWPVVAPGGVYVIEDLHTSYFPDYGTNSRVDQTTVEFLKGQIDGLNRGPTDLLAKGKSGRKTSTPTGQELADLQSIQFYGCLCFLRKQPREVGGG